MDAIRSSGIGNLKKTQISKDSDSGALLNNSAKCNPLRSKDGPTMPPKDNPASFQAELLSKKLSPAKDRNIGQRIPQEMSRPTFESQLFEKIRKRAQILDNHSSQNDKVVQVNDDEKSNQVFGATPLTKSKDSKMIANQLESSADALRIMSPNSKSVDFDSMSINSSRRSILG